MTSPQQRVQAVLEDLIGRGVERGLQVAAFLEGRLIVDTWAGTDAAGRPLDGDSLFVAYSCTKALTATVIHLLAERGQLDYDQPIARHWPAFASGPAAEIKRTITIQHALCHQAGLVHLPAGVTREALLNWPEMVRWIETAEPLWAPGTQTGYHAVTFGWILGELARRVDGRNIGRIVAEDLAGPAGVRDSLFVGARHDVRGRIAQLESAPPNPRVPVPPLDHMAFKAIPLQLYPLHVGANDPEAWMTELPASGGVMSARGLARFYASLIGKPVNGRGPLLPADRITQATRTVTRDADLVLALPVPKRMGYFGGYALSGMSRSETAFGHPGAGGSSGYADPASGLCLAVMKSRLVTPDAPDQGAARVIEQAVRDALGA
ncbi:MAG: beta-lactamase family protein [Thermoflexales bacterium]|nr:beta-lactamase family protein [Thermoflexales bacterium]